VVASPGSRTSDTNPGPLQHPGNKGRERLTSSLCACGAWLGELGLEPTPALFIEHLVAIFEEVRRVLHPSGLCFVNLGDSYQSTSGGGQQVQQTNTGAGLATRRQPANVTNIPPKSLLLIPERFAIAMQEAGWIVRSRIAWCKKSAMPESVKDRPTSAWEHIWMFSKSRTYYYDAEAVVQPSTERTLNETRSSRSNPPGYSGNPNAVGVTGHPMGSRTSANLRNFWLLGPEPSSLNHYAAFPTEIPKRCILAGTPQRGVCPKCLSHRERLVERERGDVDGIGRPKAGPGGYGSATSTLSLSGNGSKEWAERGAKVRTVDWRPSCRCDAGPPIPATVLDPFLGSGTTLLVANRLGRSGVGIELNESYARMAAERIENDAGWLADVHVETPEPARQHDLFEALG
jgi:DNA modification methylase